MSAFTGLVPNEMHLGRLPRFPVAGFQHDHLVGNQSLERGQSAYVYLIKDRQRRAYKLVPELHALPLACLASSDAKLLDLFHRRPRCTAGDGVWVYNAEATPRQGSCKRVRS